MANLLYIVHIFLQYISFSEIESRLFLRHREAYTNVSSISMFFLSTEEFFIFTPRKFVFDAKAFQMPKDMVSFFCCCLLKYCKT